MEKRTVELRRNSNLIGSIMALVLRKPIDGVYGTLRNADTKHLPPFEIKLTEGRLVAEIA